MKRIENKTISRVLTLLLFVTLTACGSKDDNKMDDNKAINDCLGAAISIPIPRSATLTVCVDAKVGKSASFRYAATWAEAVDFFKKEYSKNSWKITSERIEDEPGTMKAAEWKVEKNGTQFSLSLSDARVNDTSGSLQGIALYFYE